MKLYDFQNEVLQQSKDLNKVAYYYDMGLGKTFIGAEKLIQLNAPLNLVVCQKSKIDDWCKHFHNNYSGIDVFDLTKKDVYQDFCFGFFETLPVVAVINYDLLFRRPELAKLSGFTLMLDESSLIQNEQSKRTKFILNKLKPANIILLSGTPTGGKYEKLYSQLYLLGYKISKSTYWNEYVEYDVEKQFNFATKQYNFYKVIKGYKNVERLKNKMAEYGCFFKKTEEVFDLPEQQFINVNVPASKEYKKFQKTDIVIVDETELVGDTTLNKLLYERQLCGMYSKEKLKALKDLLSSSEDRFIIFYNFNHEGNKVLEICAELEKPLSLVNGNVKDLTKYENESNSVTLIQYQAGAMGLNLQKANKIIYFTPCLSSELFEQSKKRTHRIGQEKPCFYYQLICNNSVEEKIYETLAMRKDFTEKLFEKELPMAENELVQFEQKEVALINSLVEFKKMQNKMEVQEKELKEQLKTAMEKHGIKSFKNDLITITYVDESESTSIDLKALEKKEPDCYAGLLADYPKVTKKNAYVRFTVKE